MDISFLDDAALLEGFMKVSTSFLPKGKSKLGALKTKDHFPWKGAIAKECWIIFDALQQGIIDNELFVFRISNEWEMRKIHIQGELIYLVSLAGRTPMLFTWKECREIVIGRVVQVFDITQALEK